MAPPPPGLFSMVMGWPTFAATCSKIVRGSRSVALPGANGTTTVTRLLGQLWAHSRWGAAIARTQAAATTAAHRRATRAFREGSIWKASFDGRSLLSCDAG